MKTLFYTFLYIPIFNTLVGIYHTIGFENLGISIILLTVVVRLVIYPLSKRALQSQEEMARIQPLLKEIQKKYETNREEQARAMLALYKEHKINPFAGILTLFIQIPVFIALFLVLRSGMTEETFHYLYSFIPRPEEIHAVFLGVFDLSAPALSRGDGGFHIVSIPNLILALSVSITQFIQSKSMVAIQKRAQSEASKKLHTQDMSAQLSHQMTYLLPILTLTISPFVSGGVSLYWVITNLFSLAQQHLLYRHHTK